MVSNGYDNNDSNHWGLLFFYGMSDCIPLYCTRHLYFFYETFKCCSDINDMCYNANTDCLVDRSKVYFAVGGSGAMVSAVALQQKNFWVSPQELACRVSIFSLCPHEYLSCTTASSHCPKSWMLGIVEHGTDGFVGGPGCEGFFSSSQRRICQVSLPQLH